MPIFLHFQGLLVESANNIAHKLCPINFSLYIIRIYEYLVGLVNGCYRHVNLPGVISC